MQLDLDNPQPYDLCFLLDEDYSHLSLVLMLETLRQANSFSKGRKYRYELVYINETPEPLSAQMAYMASAKRVSDLNQSDVFDMVVILGGNTLSATTASNLQDFIAYQYKQGAWLAGIESGVYRLASLGVLNKKSASCHADHLMDLSNLYPSIMFNKHTYSFSECVYTCAGGMATVDMALDLIDRITPLVTQTLYEKMVIKEPHTNTSSQTSYRHNRFSGLGESLINAIELMESNLDEPLEMPEIAFHCGVSTRQLERLFQKHFSNTPKKYYLQLRLKRARNKILNTSHPILDVAVSCGFVAPTHFSKCYKDFFGISPRQDRMSIFSLQNLMLSKPMQG